VSTVQDTTTLKRLEEDASLRKNKKRVNEGEEEEIPGNAWFRHAVEKNRIMFGALFRKEELLGNREGEGRFLGWRERRSEV